MINAKIANENTDTSPNRKLVLKQYEQTYESVLNRIEKVIENCSRLGFNFVKMYFTEFFYDLNQEYLTSLTNYLKSLGFRVNVLHGRTTSEILIEIIW